MGLGDSFKKGLAELAEDEEENAAPRSGRDKPQSGWSFFTTEGYDYYDPPDDEMHKYWRAFEEMPYVRRAITSFAREVVEPGWWIEAENDREAEKLAKWLRNAAVIDGEKNQDLALLLKQALVQREVRGTALVEHAPAESDPDTLAGLKLINPETVSTFTKDGSSILLEPDDNVPDDVPTKEGEAPAYVQFWDERFTRDPKPFTKDEITKLPRDADIGDPYGTSALKTVLPRIESYRTKMDDLDAAIKHKAWQVWIFQFGPDDDPWHPDDIDDFMDEESPEAFTPGTKHGVQGDIDVETVGGEVPDIQEELTHDLDHIMSALPMPKWAIGQVDYLPQAVADAQENLLVNQVKEARRDLEYRFQEIVDKKAEELGYESDDIKLHISPPNEDEPNPYKDKGTVIRYESNANQQTSQRDGGVQQEDSVGVPADEGGFGPGGGSSDSEGSEESEQSFRQVDEAAELESPSEGDVVRTPDGKGVVAVEMAESFTWPPSGEQVTATRNNTAYVVGLVQGGSAVYRADDLRSSGFRGGAPRLGDAIRAKAENVYNEMEEPFSLAEASMGMADDWQVAELEALAGPDGIGRDVGLETLPDHWTRKTVLKWWADMGGNWNSCHRQLKDKLGPMRAKRHCSAYKDEVLGFGTWRGTF